MFAKFEFIHLLSKWINMACCWEAVPRADCLPMCLLLAVAMGYSAYLEVQKVVQRPELAKQFGHICDEGGAA